MYHNATHNIGLGSYNDDKFKFAIYDCDLHTDKTHNNFKGLVKGYLHPSFLAITKRVLVSYLD